MANQPMRKDGTGLKVEKQIRPTEKFDSPAAFFNWYLENQVKRTTDNYAQNGYEVVSVGWRTTKNDRVTEIRVCVKVNVNDGFFDRQTNAENLVRLTIPGVRQPAVYATDDKKPDYLVVSFFAFDEKPFSPR